jgi:hypothetical protein
MTDYNDWKAWERKDFIHGVIIGLILLLILVFVGWRAVLSYL